MFSYLNLKVRSERGQLEQPGKVVKTLVLCNTDSKSPIGTVDHIISTLQFAKVGDLQRTIQKLPYQVIPIPLKQAHLFYFAHQDEWMHTDHFNSSQGLNLRHSLWNLGFAL